MTISRTGLRAAAVALLATLVRSVAVVAPASACACGETEDILLSFDMFPWAQDVALILPLLAKAELDVADVGAGQLPRVRDEVAEATRPYLREGWVIAAIKLTAGPDSPHALDGELQPIRATFPSREIVYPMRMQATAASVSTLRVYTLTDYRTAARRSSRPTTPGTCGSSCRRRGPSPSGSSP